MYNFLGAGSGAAYFAALAPDLHGAAPAPCFFSSSGSDSKRPKHACPFRLLSPTKLYRNFSCICILPQTNLFSRVEVLE